MLIARVCHGGIQRACDITVPSVSDHTGITYSRAYKCAVITLICVLSKSNTGEVFLSRRIDVVNSVPVLAKLVGVTARLEVRIKVVSPPRVEFVTAIWTLRVDHI